MQQQLQSYWSAPQPQGSLAQQPVAPWAAPSGGGPSAEASRNQSWASGDRWVASGDRWVNAEPTGTWYPTQPGLAYFDTQDQEESDSSATSSDSGTEQLPEPAVSGMSSVDAAHHIYMQMMAAMRTWRRFTGRPVRKFRRFFKARKARAEEKEKEARAKPSCGPKKMWSPSSLGRGRGK